MKKVLSLVLALSMMLSVLSVTSFAEGDSSGNLMTPAEAKTLNLPAFPGAEGGGKFTTGGRGGEVYEVTNLNDSGEGSLRDAVSQPNRTIVFKVSGTIYLKSRLTLSQPNITIAGQTAPGDGICIGDNNVYIGADNIIIRYIRFRLGGRTGVEDDALTARYQKDIIVDHCSTSWSSDETLSLYSVANTTVQWCISSESITLGVHAKGRHGYGGIWGGADVTYHHNLVATHTSRLPRYASKVSSHPDFKDYNGNDMVNNVLYNWAFNNTYGAEEATLNIVNNYYKPGALTVDKYFGRIYNPSAGGIFYVNGNVLEGSKEVTENNMLGVQPSDKNANLVYGDAPNYDFLTPMDNVDTAEDAYTKILADVGATLPKRDSYDAKVIDDVQRGTGRAINSETEVGGWPELDSAEAPLDTDHDGMPDEWEVANGLDKNSKDDGKQISSTGYTNLENYLNSVVENASLPQNPDVSISNINQNQIFEFGKAIDINADAKAVSGRTITKVEFFDGNKKLGEGTGAPYTFTYNNIEEGTHYLSARAVDSNGEATTSEIKVVHVNYNTDISPWTSLDIGNNPVSGSASYKDGMYIVKSAGLIGPDFENNEGAEDDDFQFMYQLMTTYGDISTKVVDVSKLNNRCVTGIMIRDNLDSTSDFALINYEIEKGGAGLSFRTRINGVYNREFTKLEALPRYIKLVREGNKVTAYHSENGTDWMELNSTEINFSEDVYAGIAVDGNKERNSLFNYTSGRFTDLTLNNYGENKIPLSQITVPKRSYTVDETIPVTVNSDEETLTKAELYVDGVKTFEYTDKPFEFSVSGLSAGSHWLTAKVYDSENATNTASTSISVSKLDDSWNISDVGNMPLAGAVDMNGGNVKIYGTGFGVEDTATEQAPYIYKQISGDVTVSFRVDEQELADYDQMGIMIRAGLEEGAESYALYFQKYNGEFFKMNNEKGQKYQFIAQQKYKKAPVWIKITKSGNIISTFYSQDGSNWTEVGSKEVNLDKYYIGIFAAPAEELLVKPFSLSEFKFEQSSDVFSDLSGFDWAKESIESLYNAGIISGYGDGTFMPSGSVTRAEFVKMLVNVLGVYDENATCNFEDVHSNEWYTPYIASAVNSGITTGTSSSTFEPDLNITRQEIVTMLYRGAKAMGINLGEASGAGSSFTDYNQVDDWAKEALNVLESYGIVTGNEDGTFAPLNNASRAEAAKLVYEILKIK